MIYTNSLSHKHTCVKIRNIWKNIWHHLLLAWLAPFNVFSSSICILTPFNISFFFMRECKSIVYTHDICIIFQSADGHVGWFQDLAIADTPIINMDEQRESLWLDIASFGHASKSDIVRSYGSSLLRKGYNHFCSSCTSLCPYWRWVRAPSFATSSLVSVTYFLDDLPSDWADFIEI